MADRDRKGREGRHDLSARDTPAYAWADRPERSPMSLPAAAWRPVPGLESVPPAVAGVWFVLGALAVTVVVAGLALWLQARDRRRVCDLVERLDRLEQVLQGQLPAVAPSRGDETAAGSESGASQVSGDVLRGRTTWVRQLVARPTAPFLPLADQAIVQVHAALHRNLTPADLAGALCVSLRTLERGLAQTLACSPRQLILAVKMREARRLLRQGARVSEVAERLGFASAFHFSRRFKGFYHAAPSELRAADRRGPGGAD